MEERRTKAASTAGFFFFANLNMFMLNYMATLEIFSLERTVVVREVAN
jgi:hypothetical protein